VSKSIVLSFSPLLHRKCRRRCLQPVEERVIFRVRQCVGRVRKPDGACVTWRAARWRPITGSSTVTSGVALSATAAPRVMAAGMLASICRRDTVLIVMLSPPAHAAMVAGSEGTVGRTSDIRRSRVAAVRSRQGEARESCDYKQLRDDFKFLSATRANIHVSGCSEDSKQLCLLR
jgi:hypothetical protein